MAPDATKHLSDVNTFHAAAHRIADLEAQVKRLEGTSNVLPDQLHRWQYNAYASNVRMDLLALDRPLPEVDRSGRREGEKKRKIGGSDLITVPFERPRQLRRPESRYFES